VLLKRHRAPATVYSSISGWRVLKDNENAFAVASYAQL
jgi:hypothetical protein